MALAAETGNQSGAPGLLALLAEAQRAAGQLAEAQGTVATALAVAAQTGQPLFDADLHRLDGDLLLATGGPADEAAARYHRALAIAREQGARSFELRAATSLARLWRDQGKRAEARDLLAPVYALVHRRLRHARPDRREGAARRAGGLISSLTDCRRGGGQPAEPLAARGLRAHGEAGAPWPCSRSGALCGSGLGMVLGGWVSETWGWRPPSPPSACPVSRSRPSCS